MDRIEGRRMEGRHMRVRTVILVVVGLVVLAVTLFRVPLATVFTLGLLLICPLLMVGMHGGGHGGGHANSPDDVGSGSDARVDGR